MSYTIYHNPRCTKSRKTLELLQKNNIEPEIIEYLVSPPSSAELIGIIKKLNISIHELVRKDEKVFKELILENPEPSNDILIELMIANPILIQRPIVIKGDKAVIGRPPENILVLL